MNELRLCVSSGLSVPRSLDRTTVRHGEVAELNLKPGDVYGLLTKMVPIRSGSMAGLFLNGNNSSVVRSSDRKPIFSGWQKTRLRKP
jgi:hypothetical protein